MRYIIFLVGLSLYGQNIVPIQGSDIIKNSRTTINNSFNRTVAIGGDFEVVRTNATTLTIGPNCSSSTPCVVDIFGTPSALTNPGVVTWGSVGGTLNVYLGPNGNIMQVKPTNVLGPLVTCNAFCDVIATVDPGSILIASWTATSPTGWDVGGYTNYFSVAHVGLANTLRNLALAVGDTAGATLSTGVMGYFLSPWACTLVGWDLMVDGGTATVETWKRASGTAIPTVSQTISTSGVSISAGTAIHSSTLTDFTTTAVTAGDMIAFNISAVATAKYLYFGLRCQE